jgi:hypothetical protein
MNDDTVFFLQCRHCLRTLEISIPYSPDSTHPHETYVEGTCGPTLTSMVLFCSHNCFRRWLKDNPDWVHQIVSGVPSKR